MSVKEIFQKNGYHVTVALIYINSGAIVLYYNIVHSKDYQMSMLGGIMIAYGLYRMLKLKNK